MAARPPRKWRRKPFAGNDWRLKMAPRPDRAGQENAMSKIALIGLGLVGRAWAISFARAGHEVALWDEKSDAVEAALRYAEEVLPDLASNGLLEELAPTVRARMRRPATLED